MKSEAIEIPRELRDGEPFMVSGQVVALDGGEMIVEPFYGRVFWESGMLLWMNGLVVNTYLMMGDRLVIFEAVRPEWMSRESRFCRRNEVGMIHTYFPSEEGIFADLEAEGVR